jgi:Protein of unknown function (DUF664)
VDIRDLLLDLFGRIPDEVHVAVDGLGPDDLIRTVVPGTNSIGWLVWHLTRVQDDHIADAFGLDQLWGSGEFAAGFGLQPDTGNSGYGHTPDDVAAVRPESVAALVDYFDAVDGRTRSLLADLTAADLDRIVDRRWDPPVTLGVRLISVADDDIQHAGQAAYLRGLLGR